MSDPIPISRADDGGASTAVAAANGAVRAGVLLAGAAGISLIANYLFLLGAGRLLGSADYGTVAALLGVLTVVLLPSGALQMAVSREVSRLEAVGEGEAAAAFSRALLLVGLKAAIPLTLAACALAVPLRDLLGIGTTAPVLIALTSVSVAVVGPAALGVLQGRQRFRALAFVATLPMVVRLGLLVALAIVGARLYGALIAITVSALAGGALSLWVVRDRLRTRADAGPVSLRPFFRYLWPVAVGLLGISLLTNVDILIAKARFSSEDAGAYAAASAFARVAFFLPATILSVLFPRAAARHARGEGAGDILGRSLIVTAAFCGLLTAGYALVGDHLVRLTFGAEFASAAGLLVPFSIAMAMFSLANVLVGYHLSRGNTRFVWMVAAAVVLQVMLLATVATSLRGLVWIDLAVGFALVTVHEVAMGSSAPALVAGFERLELGDKMQRVLSSIAHLRTALLESAVVLSGYTALAVAVTWPLAAQLNSRMLGPFPNDGSGGVAWLWELHHEGGYHLLGTTHHTLTGAPLGWDQGNALNFQWIWPYYPMYLLAGVVGEIAAFNLVVLAGLVLSAAVMYLLVRVLGCGRAVSAWAGLVYMIFPWHMQRAIAGHGSLVHIEIFPLLLLAAIAWVKRPTDGRALCVAAAVTAAWLTSGYFGTIALLSLVGVSAVGFWAQRQVGGFRLAVRKGVTLWGLAIVGSGTLAVIAVFAGGTAGISLGRSAGDIGLYGAHLRDYLPAPIHSLTGSVARRLNGSLVRSDYPGAERPVFPGILTAFLALFWLWTLRRGRVTSTAVRVATGSLVAVTVVAILFAMPNPITIFGVRIKPMPSYLVYQLVPSFRVPLRLTALILAGLVPLAAFGLQAISRSSARRFISSRAAATSVSVGVCVLACAISIAELGMYPLPSSHVGLAPKAYAAVAQTPSGVLAEYPLDITDSSNTAKYIFWQRVHRRRLLNGASIYTPANDIRRMLVDPSAPGTAGSLALLGVTAIVTRPTTYDWNKIKNVPDKADYGAGYALVDRLPADIRVWRVTAPQAPAIAAYRETDIGEALARDRDGFVGYELLHPVAHVDIYAKQSGLWDIHFETRNRSAVAALAIAGKNGTRVVQLRPGVVSVSILVPRGTSTFTIALHGGTSRTRSTDHTGVFLSSPWFGPATSRDRATAIHPLLTSTEPGF